MEDNKLDPKDTFASHGRTYQEKVVQALLQDSLFAEQMTDVLDCRFFDLTYLQTISGKFFEHKSKYKTFPSADMLAVMIKKDPNVDQETVKLSLEYIESLKLHPLNGDAGFIQDSSLDFCRKQALKNAFIKSIDKMQESKFDDIAPIIRNALSAGAQRDLGHDYAECFAMRSERSHRKPLPTGWPLLDKALNGGWERGTLSTFIAPTGAGKSHFLVNCGAAGVENGFNVLYVTLEMADFKIGLRFDSYYSGVKINDIPDNRQFVESSAMSKIKGRLMIKEFPTKSATVQTVRSYIQRLQATKEFTPDIVIVDYADLMRGSRGHADKRFELEGNYEELRALAQEFNMVVLTADQTNRSGLDMEVVTVGQIGESYAKATVCDLIMTVSRTMEDKQNNTGRLFVAKSRLGRDGMIYPFVMDPATVKVRMMEESMTLDDMKLLTDAKVKQRLAEDFTRFSANREKKSAVS